MVGDQQAGRRGRELPEDGMGPITTMSSSAATVAATRMTCSNWSLVTSFPLALTVAENLTSRGRADRIDEG